MATLNVYGENLDTATAVRVRSADGRVHASKIVARPEARFCREWSASDSHPTLIAGPLGRTIT